MSKNLSLQLIYSKFDIQRIFGIVMFVNYISYYFIFDKHSENQYTSIILRSIASLLCFILIFFKYDENNKLKKFYWYLTLTYCLPFFFAFMTLINNLSTSWLMNTVSATFFLIILLELRIFIRLFIVGVSSAFILYEYILHYSIKYVPTSIGPKDFVATYFAVIVIGSIFALNRDIVAKEQKKIASKMKELNQTLEHKIKERIKELEKALSAKAEFLNNMSHEIRTPVLGFTTISEGLVENWDILNAEKKLKYAKDIANSAERLGSLISNILDLSTFVANKMQMNFAKVDLNKLIEEIINETEVLCANNKAVHINYTPVKDAFTKTDKEWILQVLRNLFSNAVKFSPDNGIIAINLKKEDKSWHFSIADTGIGIPESELKDIFIPFTQSSLTKTKAGGRGLGLAIAKEIIEAHDGKIWAENNVKGGASFHFIIP